MCVDRSTAARLGIDPKNIWFVGDRLDTDIAGARAAKMTANLPEQRYLQLRAARLHQPAPPANPGD